MKIVTHLLITILIILTIFTFSSCFLLCEHQWTEATCTTPSTCQLCGEIKGKAADHQFEIATCTTPKTCKICEETDGKPLGHIEGDWILTQEPTLISSGVKKMFCTKCNDVLDSCTVDKKAPRVEYDSFNFTDDELIDWINDISTLQIGHTELGIFDANSTNTSYRITMSSGEKGALLLNHGDNGKDGKICAIMVYFEYWANAASVPIYIGNQIDSNFSSDDAILKVAYNKPYTKADMTVMRLELDADFEVTILAPSEHLADILS